MTIQIGSLSEDYPTDLWDKSLALYGITPYMPAPSPNESTGAYVSQMTDAPYTTSNFSGINLENELNNFIPALTTNPGVTTPGGNNWLGIVGNFKDNPMSVSDDLTVSGSTPSGNSSVVNTSNPGGIAGLFTAGEKFTSNLFVRGGVLLLGIVFVAAGLWLFKGGGIEKIKEATA